MATLGRFASELASYGVRRVNVSLDTLDEARFARIHPLGQIAAGVAGDRGREGCRPARQDQHRGAEGLQRDGVRSHRLVRR